MILLETQLLVTAAYSNVCCGALHESTTDHTVCHRARTLCRICPIVVRARWTYQLPGTQRGQMDGSRINIMSSISCLRKISGRRPLKKDLNRVSCNIGVSLTTVDDVQSGYREFGHFRVTLYVSTSMSDVHRCVIRCRPRQIILSTQQ